MNPSLPEGVCEFLTPVRGDNNGSLIASEGLVNIPFEIKRVYTLFGTKSDFVRGKHAHIGMNQVIQNVTGSFDLTVDDGRKRAVIKMNQPGQCVTINGTIWRELSNFSENSVINCYADKLYRDCVYIHSYEDFLEKVKCQ